MSVAILRALAELQVCTYIDQKPTNALNDERRRLAADARDELDAMGAREAALKVEVEQLIRQRDLARRGCLCDGYGARGHHGCCPSLKPVPTAPESPCPDWCATYLHTDMSSAFDGDRRYNTDACRAAGKCVGKEPG